ncbi:MAG: hypothetical protein AAFQ58_14410 [Pseudomonadota bacterium]
MRYITMIFTTVALGACTSPISNAKGPTGPELPPLGLASTAIWLEQREALTPQSRARAAEIQAAQRAADQQVAAVQPQPAAQRPVIAVSDGVLLASAINGFASGCIANAPRFGASPVSAFGVLKPVFDAGLTLESSGDRRVSCEYRYIGYGTNRPRPSADQMVRLAQALQERVGGTVSAPRTVGAGTTISLENTSDTYTLESTLDESGTLALSVGR